jgi:hypothetical protein
MSDELPTAGRVPGTSASARMRKRSERKLLNVSDLFPPSCQKAGKGGIKLCNRGLNFSVGRSRNPVLVNQAFQLKREIHLYPTCIYRWRKNR